jgi:hypothetical protein
MTTLLIDRRNGTIRRCDLQCYRASGDTCRCICLGAHHGVGLNAASAHALGMKLKRGVRRFTKVQLELPVEPEFLTRLPARYLGPPVPIPENRPADDPPGNFVFDFDGTPTEPENG